MTQPGDRCRSGGRVSPRPVAPVNPFAIESACHGPDFQDGRESGRSFVGTLAFDGRGSVSYVDHTPANTNSCRNATFNLTAPVVFTADGQQIYTEGLPADDRRALLRIASSSVVTAVDMFERSGVVLRNVRIDGSRPSYGHRTGEALIRAGGNASGQVVLEVKVWEPRTWSILHLFEGGCTGAIVEAETRTLLGGINMVDYAVYNGNFTNTRVRRNVIDVAGAVIRIGIGMGWRVWVCVDPGSPDDPTIFGALVTDNTLRGEHMQYGLAIEDPAPAAKPNPSGCLAAERAAR